MLEEYDWWGKGDRPPPPHLKTRRQLAELGLRPKKPVGVIHTRKYDCLLYDPQNPDSVSAQQVKTQLDILDANPGYQLHPRDSSLIEHDRLAAVQWAKETLADPAWTILDTETTGARRSEIVEIAIIDLTGNPLLNTLAKPQQRISRGATAVHGLTAADVADAPSFPEIYPQLVDVLSDRRVLIYNAKFDIEVLNYCCEVYQLPRLNLEERSACVMEWYAQWFGDWSSKYGSYRWQRLGGAHRALGDCRATLERLNTMTD